MKKVLLSMFTALTISASNAAYSQETIPLGLSVPLSGAGAVWGRGLEWTAKQAAKSINDAGGIEVDGKKYLFEVLAYDNKFNAADGAKVAQTLINQKGVRYIVGAVGTAPTKALQSLSERKGVLLFTTSWGKSLKGPSFPLTFTQSNTPIEILEPLYTYIKQQNPTIKTVAILNPNDASGKETEQESRKVWEDRGVDVISSDWLCCTNQLNAEVPLPPDGLIPRAL